jgi:hypothetical protein
MSKTPGCVRETSANAASERCFRDLDIFLGVEGLDTTDFLVGRLGFLFAEWTPTLLVRKETASEFDRCVSLDFVNS